MFGKPELSLCFLVAIKGDSSTVSGWDKKASYMLCAFCLWPIDVTFSHTQTQSPCHRLLVACWIGIHIIN